MRLLPDRAGQSRERACSPSCLSMPSRCVGSMPPARRTPPRATSLASHCNFPLAVGERGDSTENESIPARRRFHPPVTVDAFPSLSKLISPESLENSHLHSSRPLPSVSLQSAEMHRKNCEPKHSLSAPCARKAQVFTSAESYRASPAASRTDWSRRHLMPCLLLHDNFFDEQYARCSSKAALYHLRKESETTVQPLNLACRHSLGQRLLSKLCHRRQLSTAAGFPSLFL